MSRFTFIILFIGLFFALVGTVQAAPVLSSLPPAGSTITIGDPVDYGWSPVSTRDNCIHFFPPGAAGWENWTCLGRNIGSYAKNTAGLNEGSLSAEIATKKCSFFGLKCSWDYSNVVKVNLVKTLSLPPPLSATPESTSITATGPDGTVTDETLFLNSRESAIITWSAPGAGPESCVINECPFDSGDSRCSGSSGSFSTGALTTGSHSYAISSCTGNVGAPHAVNVDVRPEPKNTAPSVFPLPPQPPADYCISPLTWTLSWNFYDPDADSFQSGYEIKFFDVATGREVFSRLSYLSSSDSYAVPAGALLFNKTYSWTIKVWDNKLATGEATGANFTTIPHSAPKIDFRWTFSGQWPAINEVINFYDETTFYDNIASASKRKWLWIFWDDLKAVGPTDSFNTQAKAGSRGEKRIKLASTDADGLTCSKTKTLQIGRRVPKIKEIFPR